MCVTSLLCGPRVQADLWPIYGFSCKRFSLYVKVYYGEKTVYIKNHKTAINQPVPVDHTGETEHTL